MNKNHLFFLSVLLIISCARPIADFTIQAEDHTAPAAVQFENTSQKAEQYEWDFGDGTVSEAFSPSHRYRSSGNYLVVLKAIKGNKMRKMEKRIKIDAPEQCLVEIETDFGSMIAVLSDATPKHRDNFSKLAEEGFYNDLLFHRVIEGFMVQGGDPGSKNAKANVPLGGGGPGYQIPAEFVDSLIHIKGALAAARTGDQVNPEKESSGSQFYIVHGRSVTDSVLDRIETSRDIRYTPKQRTAYKEYGGTPFLDQNYTVFGKVISGLDVLDKIAAVEKDRRDRPMSDIKMKIRLIK